MAFDRKDSSTPKKKETQLHPGLMTPSQATKEKSKVLSDCLPILTKMGLLDFDNKPKTVTLLSWDCMMSDRPSGLGNFNESKIEIANRQQRQLNALAKMIELNKPQIITLQNVAKYDLKLLREWLKERDWGMEINKTPPDVITLYDKNQCDLNRLSEESEKKSAQQLAMIHSNKILRTPIHMEMLDFTVTNLIMEPDDPVTTQESLRALLLSDQKEFGDSILCGDFQARYSHTKMDNLTTKVIFDPDTKQQVAEGTTGVFYTTGFPGERQVVSSPNRITVLDPSTGGIFTQVDIPSSSFKKTVLSVTDEYKSSLNNKHVYRELAQDHNKSLDEHLSDLKSIDGYMVLKAGMGNNLTGDIHFVKPTSPNKNLTLLVNSLKLLDNSKSPVMLRHATARVMDLDLVEAANSDEKELVTAVEKAKEGKTKETNQTLSELHNKHGVLKQLQFFKQTAVEAKLEKTQTNLFCQAMILAPYPDSVKEVMSLTQKFEPVAPLLAQSCLLRLDPTNMSKEEKTNLLLAILQCEVDIEIAKIDNNIKKRGVVGQILGKNLAEIKGHFQNLRTINPNYKQIYNDDNIKDVMLKAINEIENPIWLTPEMKKDYDKGRTAAFTATCQKLRQLIEQFNDRLQPKVSKEAKKT